MLSFSVSTHNHNHNKLFAVGAAPCRAFKGAFMNVDLGLNVQRFVFDSDF